MPDNSQEISPKALQVLQKQILEDKAATEKEMATKATYKIQVRFRHNRTGRTHTAVTLSFWESGKRLHGGGDESMFICQRRPEAPKPKRLDVIGANNPSVNGCSNVIPGGLAQANGLIVCPHCQQRWRTDHIGDSIFYNVDMDKLAEIIERWWHKLGRDADIFVKFDPTDPRTLAQADAFGLARARELRGLMIYPLANIIKDTLNGASVKSRFKAMLLS